MSDNELLLEISIMMDTKLNARLKPIENNIQTRLNSIENNVKLIQCDMQARLSSVENNMQTMRTEIHNVKLFQENVILPRLNTIEPCYTDTFNRYMDYADKMDEVFDDVDLLKETVSSHSEKLQKLA